MIYKIPLITIKPLGKIHGINPKIIVEQTGKTFELPRFCSYEMQQAVIMNKIAAKGWQQQVRDFPNASAQDFIRLTSSNIEDCFNRVTWINPQNLKEYNLLKIPNKNDKKTTVRILDNLGKFIKETDITPANIIILDNNCRAIYTKTGIEELDKLTHSNAVEIFAKRNNPFANYQIINCDEIEKGEEFAYFNTKKMIKNLYNINYRVDNGEKIDYIICAWGHDISFSDKSKIPEDAFIMSELLSNLTKKGVRVIMASPNSRTNMYNAEIVNGKNIEGVGSLNLEGKISDFSSARNSRYTQHYEIGEHPIIITSQGINITTLRGTDIAINNKIMTLQPRPLNINLCGTSFATTIRGAKSALNDMMRNIL